MQTVIEAVTDGLRSPLYFWTLMVVLLAIAGGMLAARAVRQRTQLRLQQARQAGEGTGVDPIAIDGVRRLAFPLTTQALLWIGEGVLRLTAVVGGTGDARLLRLAMTLFGAMAVIRLLVYVLRRVLRNVAAITAFERVIAAVIWAAFALHVTGLLDGTITWLESTQLPLGAARVSLWALITGLVSVAATLLVALWVGAVIESRLMKTEALDGNVRAVVARLLRAALILVGVLMALSMVGIDLTVLSVFGGALGVGLGLGLQRIASNYVSGFIILLDRSLRLGDIIAVDRFAGTVAQINTRYTVLRSPDGTEALVPNEMLVANPVVNQSFSDSNVRMTIKVAVAYGTEVAPALRVLEEAARRHRRVLSNPAPTAFLTGFGADGLDLEVGFWIGDPQNGRLSVQSEVAQDIYASFRDAGISIPFPQRELRITQGDASVVAPRQQPPKAA
jgi:small-conductance mechanosensitive channel